MRKKKQRFAENNLANNIIQPGKPNFNAIQGNWYDFFGNKNPITVELGCGRGEYSVALAERFPEQNFIGVDTQGERIWFGSQHAIQNNMNNVAFLRTGIERLDQFFAIDEINEIWITFPGPRPKRKESNKRLTNNRFLDLYKSLLALGGMIHLKTDSDFVYGYTLGILEGRNDIEQLAATNDIYRSPLRENAHDIQTYFEQKNPSGSATIKYLEFGFIAEE